jgi:hypothetical protein
MMVTGFKYIGWFSEVDNERAVASSDVCLLSIASDMESNHIKNIDVCIHRQWGAYIYDSSFARYST